MGKKIKNDEIKAKKVLLIDLDGDKIGEVSKEEALKIAKDNEVDLVQVNFGNVPVCKLMDFGKELYVKEKKQKLMKKNNKHQKSKEVRFSTDIAEHDLKTKTDHISKFLESGYKVKCSLKIRKRTGFVASEIEKKFWSILEMITSPYKKEGDLNKTHYMWSINIVPAKK